MSRLSVALSMRVKELKALFPLILIIAVAVLLRVSINFSTSLMPKVNGAYYLIQVRSLLQTGALAYDDFPFVFWLESLVARLLFILKVGDLSRCILLASKVVDSVLPTLITLPAFLITLQWSQRRQRETWSAVAVASFSVLYYPMIIMTSDFQKNAIGMLWLICCIYSLHQALQKRTWRTYAAAGAFFLLAGVTHLGSFAVTLAYVSLIGVTSALLVPRQRKTLLITSLAGIVGLAVVLECLYLFVDPHRMSKLLGMLALPFTLFERPFILGVLTRQGGPVSPFDITNLAVIHAISLAGIFVLAKQWSGLNASCKTIVIAAILMSIFLASPFITQERAGRFYLMAFMPAAVVLSFLLTHLEQGAYSFGIASLVLVLSTGSAFATVRPVSAPCIPEESFTELLQLKSKIANLERTLVIARHGLEWWAGWVLGTRVAQEFQVVPEDWKKYKSVFFLQQISWGRNFGLAGPATAFPEVWIPDEARILFRGHYLLLAQSDSPPNFYPLPKPWEISGVGRRDWKRYGHPNIAWLYEDVVLKW